MYTNIHYYKHTILFTNIADTFQRDSGTPYTELTGQF